jgi:4-amino-4-deoxy-L-arabinose transferase-like glycosyltransferase
MRFLRSNTTWMLIALLLTAAWKAALLAWDVVPFNSDEAVVALMARHILAGERPAFFYGQAYMGSMDAFLAAGFFWLFGEQVWCIRLVQCLLYLGTVATTILLGKEAFGDTRAGILAALLLAIPTVNVSLYTTASLGGYGEALLLGNLILWLALSTARRWIQAEGTRFPAGRWGIWGVLVGGGLWANGLTLVYSIPAALYLFWGLWKQKRSWIAPFLLAAGAGFLVGSSPWWAYALGHGVDRLVLELLGTAVSVEPGSWWARLGSHGVNFFLLGVSVIFGFRPPWAVRWLALPAIPFVLLFWMAVMGFIGRQLLRRSPERGSYLLLAGVGAVLLAGFLCTSFGVDPSGRYFLPFAVLLALFGARFMMARCCRPWQAGALVALVVGYQLVGTVQCVLANPPGLTTQFYEPTIIDHRADQELIAFLRREGETRGYSNYWVAYPLAFLSQEELIFAPRLPYHLDLRYTPRDDRYAPYLAEVQRSPVTAYITTRNPALDRLLRERFGALGVRWSEVKIGDYQVYYHLSRAVHPQEIGLGELVE